MLSFVHTQHTPTTCILRYVIMCVRNGFWYCIKAYIPVTQRIRHPTYPMSWLGLARRMEMEIVEIKIKEKNTKTKWNGRQLRKLNKCTHKLQKNKIVPTKYILTEYAMPSTASHRPIVDSCSSFLFSSANRTPRKHSFLHKIVWMQPNILD